MLEISRKALWDQRKNLFGWAIGLAGATFIYTGVYGVFDPTEFDTIMDSLPDTMIQAFGWENMASPSGYLGSTVYGLVVPILTIVFAIAFGTRLLAADEEAGTLELIATYPVSRISLVLQRGLTVGVASFAMATVVFAVAALLAGPVELEVPLGNLLAASFQLGLLALVFGSLVMAMGGFIGRRGVVMGAAAVVAVVSYFGSTIVPQISGLAWFQNLSVFHYYGGARVLEGGFVVTDALILIGLSVIFVALAAFAFNRRDIGTA
jgi:ABC-2 type transport system permease protein